MSHQFTTRFLRPASLGALVVILAGSACARAEKPNILFILTDDQGWPTLGCYGNKLVPTPHLDNLASEGLRFTAAYVMPQCTPTRAALLTGQHTARTRMWHVIPGYGYPYARLQEPRYNRDLPRDTFTVAKGLRAAGYATGIIGKWHVTANADGDYSGLKPQTAAYYGFDSSVPSVGGESGKGDKGVDRFTEAAMRFIETHRDHPWFLYLAYHTIHGPVLAPEALVQKHLADGAPAAGLHNATYLAAIEHMDHAVGRLLSRIDSLKLREKTLVVFLSDNGGIYQINQAKPFLATGEATQQTPASLAVDREEFSNAPLRAGKGSHYEGGIRVPCIVRWPGMTPTGRVSDTPIHVTDWLPTLLEAAGSRAPASHPLDGVSLLPLLRGGRLPARALFWYMPFYEVRWGATPCAIIREGDWKLIEFFGDTFDAQGRYSIGHRLELFQLRDDPGETRNRAGAEPLRAKQMQDSLHNWLQSVGAAIPGRNPQFSEPRQLLETRAGY